VAEWSRLDNEMAVLTTYLHHIHQYVNEKGENTIPDSLPHLCTTIRGGNGLVRNEGASMIGGSKWPQMCALWGAGLSFSKCHAERRVLVDSHTLWMLDGEGFLRASHLWTHGYDLYSPSGLGSVVYHNYSSVPARFVSLLVLIVKFFSYSSLSLLSSGLRMFVSIFRKSSSRARWRRIVSD
jgi:Glycosyltransferase (GlcNAc)